MKGLLLLPLFALGTGLQAQQTQLVQLDRQGIAKIQGKVRGSNYIDYHVAMGAGQTIALTLRSDNESVFFNFNPPKSDVTMFNGSELENKMQPRMVPAAGKYIVRVYQMGAAKSEGQLGHFTLGVHVTGTALKPLAGAKFGNGKFHAKGVVVCSVQGESLTRCEALVTRYGNGTAMVELRAGRTTRRVLFLRGVPKACDSREAFTYTRKGDDTIVRFGDDPSEKYSIPDVLLQGS